MSADWSLRLVASEKVRPGRRVKFTLTLTNTAARQIDFYLRGREPVFDITLADSDDRIVWRRLQGEIIPAILQIRALAPGKTLELHAHWDQRNNAGEQVAPGDYSARGYLLTEGDPLASPPITLRIESP